MKNILKVIGFLAIVASMLNVVILALDGYNKNLLNIGAFTFVALLGFVLIIFAEGLKPRISEQEMAEAMKSLQRKYLREQMLEWNRELTEEEFEKLSRGQ